MSDEQSEDDTREIAIEAWNIIFGRAVFAYMRLPAMWVTGYQMNNPMVTNPVLYKNLIWVGIGETECLISRERGTEKRPGLDFRLKLVVDLQKKESIAPTPSELRNQHESKGHHVVESGELHAAGHTGSYILWTHSKRRFGIIGRPQLVAKLRGHIPCDETKRLLTLTWTSPSPNLILEYSAQLVASLNSVLCHGH